jgi:hypothetical protein
MPMTAHLPSWKFSALACDVKAEDPPEPFARFFRVFSGNDASRWAASVSGCDTSAGTVVQAARYMPGDYALPHRDAVSTRTLSFIWHLTKGWNPRWGGHLFWCSPPTYILPTFNTLTLFKVKGFAGAHEVCPVDPVATGKRMAINGWWQGRGAPWPRRPIGRRPIEGIEGSGALDLGHGIHEIRPRTRSE